MISSQLDVDVAEVGYDEDSEDYLTDGTVTPFVKYTMFVALMLRQEMSMTAWPPTSTELSEDSINVLTLLDVQLFNMAYGWRLFDKHIIL